MDRYEPILLVPVLEEGPYWNLLGISSPADRDIAKLDHAMNLHMKFLHNNCTIFLSERSGKVASKRFQGAMEYVEMHVPPHSVITRPLMYSGMFGEVQTAIRYLKEEPQNIRKVIFVGNASQRPHILSIARAAFGAHQLRSSMQVDAHSEHVGLLARIGSFLKSFSEPPPANIPAKAPKRIS
ncbi:MAG: hypothetical protein AAB472_02920 [Patescibacteria group bacterium]